MIKEYTDMALIDVAYDLLTDDKVKKPKNFKLIFEDVVKALGLSEEEANKKMIQFYTDLNVDGRFTCNPEKLWGLKSWFLVEQIEEDIAPTAKSRKKTKVAADEFDSIEEVELEEYLAIEEDFDGEIDDDEDDEDEEEEDEVDIVELVIDDDLEAVDVEDVSVEVDDDEEEVGESLEELVSEELEENEEDEM